MNNSAKMTDRAKVLLEALPFIQQFHDKIIVVKLGGRVISNEEMLNTLLQDIVLLNLFGMKMVVVHGGGPEISEEMRKSGVKPKFIEGLRVTDEKTMEILHEQLAGKINKQIVLGINHHGGKAFGISGMDGNLIRARKLIYKTTTSKGKEVEIDLGLVGEVEKIDPAIIHNFLKAGCIPVIAPIGIDAEGHSLNINADMVAAELAGAVRAKKLVIITDVMGVMRDPNDEKTLISTLTADEIQSLMQQGIIKKGMIPKVEACLKALQLGVERCHIINGNIPHVLLLEILTETGVGTMIVRGK
ncbi:MAG: acetylglutamate kinase [Candidatus Hadarchaeum yellowstonense]|uniref:Acetylglutamate kinase n=1 Tax=Hadarchaeum yellowstonense TaxID=1776334 RepID=A0A147JVD3_HADYE|nr:MAG: acetylglutamate kinase [Candidatus Hadarchaeum yellowstonense]